MVINEILYYAVKVNNNSICVEFDSKAEKIIYKDGKFYIDQKLNYDDIIPVNKMEIISYLIPNGEV